MKPSPRNRRRTARLAAVGAVALFAGALPGTGSQAREQEAKVTAVYDCAVPSGKARAEVVFTGNFPEAAAPGKPLRPGELSAEVRVGRDALADVLPDGTESVTSRAALTVRVAQGDTSADADWSDLKAPSTPVSESGDLTLTHQGEVPPVTVAAEGEVTFTAGDLALELDPKAPEAPEAPPSEGAPTTLPAAATPRLTCEAAPDQELRLATVRVSGADEGTESPSPSEPPGASGSPRPEEGREDGAAARRDAGIDVGDEVMPPAKPCEKERTTAKMDRSKLPAPPPGTPVDVNAGTHWCTVPVAVSNVLKLRGAMLINDPRDGATTANLLINVESASDGVYNQTRSVGEVDLPDATATFLNFDLMPVTARIEFISSPMTIVTEQRTPTANNYATVYMNQTLRMHDVKVNGRPLPVGPNCRTAKPIELALKGVAPEYHVFTGGVLRAKLDIPPFTGCGTGGENLNPLFTGSISGGGNYIKMVQGAPCYMLPNIGCTPKVPELPK